CATLAFGLGPALRASRVDVLAMIRQHSGAAARPPRWTAGGGTSIAVQVMVSFALLAAVGLMARTVLNLRTVDVGYEPSRVVFATIHPAGRPRAFIEDALNRLRRLPGVTAVSASQWPIFNNAEPKVPVCIRADAAEEH